MLDWETQVTLQSLIVENTEDTGCTEKGKHASNTVQCCQVESKGLSLGHH